ncbi:mitochondrial chaperone [Perkinsus chesapeaki]|uniref:Mitochondrial chaperone n=1 Tax=Perkinsus chesapeaki TaxID=330153 RepID=A0A7J6MVV2_PERCH|nr:mitochondrial chaperone [Perkinsus chesapeaki]
MDSCEESRMCALDTISTSVSHAPPKDSPTDGGGAIGEDANWILIIDLFVTGPDSATNRLPLYTAGNHIERCSKNRDFATRPISGVYCGVTYNLNASNADESQLGALGEGLFVTDYAPVIQYHPSIYLGSFSFVVGTFWGPMNLTSFDTPGLLETSPRNNPLTYNIDTRGNISSVLYYDQISVYVRTSLLDKVGDAQSIAVSYQNRYTMQLSADRLSCPEMYGRITDIVELGGVDGPNPGILPTVTEDKWKNAQGLVIGCIAALIMVIFGVWAIRVDRQHKKEFKKRTALVIPS